MGGPLPLARRADAAVVGCWLAVGGALLGIGTDVRRIVLVSQAIADPTLVPQAADADGPVALATVVGLLTMLAALVLVGRWALRLRDNVRVLGGPARADGARRGHAALAAVALVLVAVVLVRFALGGDTPQAVRTADWLDVATQALLAALALVGAFAVGRVTRAHEDRVRAGEGFATPVAPAPEDASTLRVRTEDDLRGRRANQP